MQIPRTSGYMKQIGDSITQMGGVVGNIGMQLHQAEAESEFRLARDQMDRLFWSNYNSILQPTDDDRANSPYDATQHDQYMVYFDDFKTTLKEGLLGRMKNPRARQEFEAQFESFAKPYAEQMQRLQNVRRSDKLKTENLLGFDDIAGDSGLSYSEKQLKLEAHAKFNTDRFILDHSEAATAKSRALQRARNEEMKNQTIAAVGRGGLEAYSQWRDNNDLGLTVGEINVLNDLAQSEFKTLQNEFTAQEIGNMRSFYRTSNVDPDQAYEVIHQNLQEAESPFVDAATKSVLEEANDQARDNRRGEIDREQTRIGSLQSAEYQAVYQEAWRAKDASLIPSDPAIRARAERMGLAGEIKGKWVEHELLTAQGYRDRIQAALDALEKAKEPKAPSPSAEYHRHAYVVGDLVDREIISPEMAHLQLDEKAAQLGISTSVNETTKGNITKPDAIRQTYTGRIKDYQSTGVLSEELAQQFWSEVDARLAKTNYEEQDREILYDSVWKKIVISGKLNQVIEDLGLDKQDQYNTMVDAVDEVFETYGKDMLNPDKRLTIDGAPAFTRDKNHLSTAEGMQRAIQDGNWRIWKQDNPEEFQAAEERLHKTQSEFLMRTLFSEWQDRPSRTQVVKYHFQPESEKPDDSGQLIFTYRGYEIALRLPEEGKKEHIYWREIGSEWTTENSVDADNWKQLRKLMRDW